MVLVNTWAWCRAEAVERDLLVAYPVIDIRAFTYFFFHLHLYFLNILCIDFRNYSISRVRSNSLYYMVVL